jgi:hypothetical protein
LNWEEKEEEEETGLVSVYRYLIKILVLVRYRDCKSHRGFLGFCIFAFGLSATPLDWKPSSFSPSEYYYWGREVYAREHYIFEMPISL